MTCNECKYFFVKSPKIGLCRLFTNLHRKTDNACEKIELKEIEKITIINGEKIYKFKD